MCCNITELNEQYTIYVLHAVAEVRRYLCLKVIMDVRTGFAKPHGTHNK